MPETARLVWTGTGCGGQVCCQAGLARVVQRFGEYALAFQGLSPSPTGRDYRPALLNPNPSTSLVSSADEPTPADPDAPPPEPHRDERQIHLDTERSFVFYPAGSMDRRHELQAELDALLVTLFRRRPQLSYFQGYHDIVTVLFLTLPPELHLACVEKLSLHRVRDSMGSSLEPVLGLLRVLKNLLRLADPSFAALLERNSPLPYYALSNLLTLFSHDVPTLPLIQHVFDYLLCRPPISVVYLGAAILLARKQEVERLEEEGEEGMVHSLLSGLPELLDGEDEPPATVVAEKCEVEEEPVLLESEDTLVDEATASKTIPTELAVSAPASVFGAMADAAPIIEAEEAPSDATADTVDSDATLADSQIRLAPSKDEKVEREEKQAPPEDEEAAQDEKHEASQPSTRSASPEPVVAKPKIQLADLLQRADDLYANFPPADPALGLATLMGPNSVVYTWSEDPAKLPTDDDAESMVSRPELIVLPHIDFPPEEDSAPNEKQQRRRRKGGNGGKKRARRIERRAMIAGAVLVLGVSIVIYGMRAGHTRGHGHARAWQKLGGALGGAADQLADAFRMWY
ncbi:hypothetical protein HWV62_38134 [Athelia sp. TMB]|nr:hypothetical protein HWV62_38134 [Athelia sp. TMB]